MADIDLKTETPDTTLPTTGFLFGADSQAAASPSVFTVQSVATTLLGSTTLSGATITADAPVLNMTQTWNNAAVTFTGLKFNAAGTSGANSAAGSLLMDLQLGGASQFKVSKSGVLTIGTGTTISTLSYNSWSNFGNRLLIGDAAPAQGVYLSSNYSLKWASGSGDITGFSADTFLSRRAAANLRLGAADAAAPVAQTLSVQSVVAGTTNTAGANLTITGSQGTGTGAGGSIIFQVAPAGSSGTAQNALANSLVMDSAHLATFTGPVRAGTSGVSTSNVNVQIGSANNGLWTNGTVYQFIVGGTAAMQWWSGGQIDINGGYSLGFGSSGVSSPDVILRRDAANTLALRNGANAQTFNVYNTFTDASNYERGIVSWSQTANRFVIGAEAAGTGTARGVQIGTGSGFVSILTSSTGRFDIYANQTTFNNASGTERWRIDASGHFIAGADNTYDIGASGANRPRNLFLGSYAQLSEMTAPAAPATNGVRIYAVDNGSGKTQLMALFATGAAQQIAIEP